ncbi:hypothetical protein, partial [Pseudoflavonifractor phocaeensis]|uniref:hypothetical protein n=1 Tax=Pseudoflavonifractor phocaeensis TaxID=1870988 RepID=UPI001959E643
RHPHVLKGMDHPNKQIFLLGIWEKLNVALAAVVADHNRASNRPTFYYAPHHIEIHVSRQRRPVERRRHQPKKPALSPKSKNHIEIILLKYLRQHRTEK